MEHRLSQPVRGLRPSVIRGMSERAAHHTGVINLGIGDPDFPTPPEVCRAALEDAVAGATHYAHSQGDPELREALAQDLASRYRPAPTAQDLVVTGGGMGALAAYFRTVLDPGDEVLVPEPMFPSYRPHVELVGGRLVQVPTRFEEGFIPTVRALEAALTERSKVLLLNSPNNPTGAVIPGPALDALARFARERDLLVVTDEVYDRFVFDGDAHDTILRRPGMAERTVVVGSFSKTYAMTGWRVGWAFGPPAIVQGMVKVVSHNTSCTPSVSQRAALAALRRDQGFVEEMVAEYARRRDRVCERLGRIPGIRVHRPAGAFYVFPDVGGVTGDSTRFAHELLDREQVVVVPGVAFGPSGEGCVRLACTVGLDALDEAMDRLERFVRGWGG